MLEIRPPAAETLDSGARDGAESGLDLEAVTRKVVAILIKRRWWVIAAATLTFGLVVVYTRQQPRVYQATATLYVELAPPRVLSGVNEVVQLGANSWLEAARYHESQAKVLRSRDLAQLVVNELGLARNEHFFGLDDPNSERTEEEKAEIMANSDAAGLLSGRVAIELEPDSNIITVSINDTDPAFAQELANTIAEKYRDRNVEKRRLAVRRANVDLSRIVGEMAARKRAAEKALAVFERDNDLSEARRTAVAQLVVTLHRQLADAKQARFDAKQVVEQIRKVRKAKALFDTGAPTVMTDSLMGSLKQEYLKLSNERADLASVYLERHPKMVSIDSRLQHLEKTARMHLKALYASASAQASALSRKTRSLEAELERIKREDSAIRTMLIEYDRLTAARDEARGFYEKVAKRLTETSLTAEVEVNNVSILDRATQPRQPVAPNVRLNLVLGLILAGFAGAAVAFGVEGLDDTIKSRQQIEDLLGTSFLGFLPSFDGEAARADGTPIPDDEVDLIAHHNPNSRTAEAARALRTNLLLMRPDDPLRAFLVTSATPREGKTTTSTTIAISLAGSTGRAVLVDTDMRRPRVHKIFGKSNDRGLTNFILGESDDIEDFVQKTVVPGLYVLPCGPIPPNPGEIMHAARFAEVVRQLREKFGAVIYDSSPINVVSDGLVLSSMVDGVILVVHANNSKRDQAREAVRSLRSVGARILGVVMSRADMNAGGYGYYYGGKYYAYQYRYATEDDD